MSSRSSTPSAPHWFGFSFWVGLVTMAMLPWWGAGCTPSPKPNPSAPATPPGASSAPQAPVVSEPAVARIPSVPAPGETSLFDGQTLTGWKEADYAGRGEVEVKEGRILIGTGVMTGITWTNDFPTNNYEISLEAMRVDGSDFFCALTFPIGEDPCSFIVGGWGGGVVGLSSIDGSDAASNETTKYLNFTNGKWFAIRLRVTTAKIQAWIDNDPVIDVDPTGKKFSIRVEVEPSRPLGIATWSTTGAVRHLRLRRL